MTNPHEVKYRQLIMGTLTGTQQASRAGDMREVFGKVIEFNFADGFPLFTGRKIFTRGVLGELAAFLEGAEHVGDFQKYGCNYWNGFADASGYLGPVYGAQWLQWGDQLKTLVETMQADPTSRRMLVSAWNVEDLPAMVLPPCHYAFQVNVEGPKFDLMVHMRSLDLMLGFPSDVFLYAVLMKLLRNETGREPRRLIFTIGSCHIYAVHEAAAFEYLSRPLVAGPLFVTVRDKLDSFTPDSVTIMGYEPNPPLALELLL